MMNRVVNYSLFFVLLTFYGYSAEKIPTLYCVPQLQGCLKKIEMVSEAKVLIDQVLKEGNVTIKLNNERLPEKFGAYWDGEGRNIVVNYTAKSNEGTLIGSIIFELHNAAIESKLRSLDQKAIKRQVSREKYIEALEYLEYLNSLKASAITDKGIKQGIFPKTAYLHTFSSFEEHFRVQKMSGHSAWIGKIYDQVRRT